MSTYRAGNNEDYVNHIISMLHFLEQRKTKDDVSRASKVVKEVKNQIKPLTTTLGSNVSKSEKEGHKLQLSHAKQDLQKAEKEALTEMVKA